MITIIGEEKLLSFESTGKIKHQIEHLNLAGKFMQYKNSGNECMIVIKNDGRSYFQVKDYIINRVNKLFPSVYIVLLKNQSNFQILPLNWSAGQPFKNGLI